MGNAYASLVITGVLLGATALPNQASTVPLVESLPSQTTTIVAQAAAANNLENTSWRLIGWQSGMRLVTPLPETTLTANFANGKVSGSAGCNNYNASFNVRGPQISIGQVASTRKACPGPVMQQENRFFNALSGAQRFTIDRRGQLSIFYRGAGGSGFLVFAPAGAPPTQPTTSWLDRSTPPNWNQPGMAIPTAPRGTSLEADMSRCGGTLRPPTASEDQALTRSGWRLFGPYQRFGNTVLINGLSSFDGMCRPMGYQSFVFVNGQFAGTLSPQPMDARTDGSTQPVSLFSQSDINASFSRYTANDALCCPSSTSLVNYKIQQQGGRPVLVPTSVSTSPNRQ